MKASYVITDFGEKIFRTNVVATVTEKFLGEDGRYISLTIDDESSAISVKAFREGVEILRNVNLGDLIRVVGKIKNYNNENYIIAEAASKIDDSNFESLHKLEVLKNLAESKKIAEEIRNLRDQLTDDELREYAKEKFDFDDEVLNIVLAGKKTEVDYRPKILDAIGRLDAGDGVEISMLMKFLNLPENLVESTLDSLLASGALYEPVIGKLKKV